MYNFETNWPSGLFNCHSGQEKIQRICHVNMLKPYTKRDSRFTQVPGNTCVTDVNFHIETEQVTDDFGPSATDVDTGFVLEHLPTERREQLRRLLDSFTDIFQDRPGRTNLCKHKIELQPNTKPIRLPPFRVNPHKAELINKELDLMIEMGVIERSTSINKPLVVSCCLGTKV